jgi:hypothetical protein
MMTPSMPDFLSNKRSDTGTWAPVERREHKFPVNRRPGETGTMVSPDAKGANQAAQRSRILSSHELIAFAMVRQMLGALPMQPGCIAPGCRQGFDAVATALGELLDGLEPAAAVAESAYDLPAYEAAQPAVQAAGPAAAPDSTVNPGRNA